MLQKIVTLLYLSGEPMRLEIMSKLLGVSSEDVEAQLGSVKQSLETIGLTLITSSDGISIVTQSVQAPLVEAFWKEELQGDLTPATLQALTLIAYIGAPTREQISYIRGVQSSQSIRTLAVRGLISRQGEICTLTGNALKHLGITRVQELPEYETIHANFMEKLEARTI